MKRERLLLGALLAVALVSGCNRPEGGWRDRNQEQSEPTQSGPVVLPEVDTDSSNEGDVLLDQLEDLMEDLDASLGTESDWQLDVPQENELESEHEANAAAIDDLLAQLESSLGTLDSVVAYESAQQLDPP